MITPFIPGIIAAIIATIRVSRDPRRISNGIFILAAAGMLWFGLVAAVGKVNENAGGTLMLLSVLILVGFIIAIGATLMANGVIVVRKEGLRASTVLAFGAGLAILAGFFGGVLLISGFFYPISTGVFGVGLFIVLAGFVLFIQLIGFFISARVYRFRPVDKDIDAVIALGCGLRNGEEVTPLLASRLERAKDVYEESKAAGGHPVIVTSGGQGYDEKVPEGVAMSRYLVDQGVPESDIVVEDKSTTTNENLKFSTDLLTEKLGRPDVNAVIATSDFHAMRAGLLAKKAGYAYQATGGRTARYYYPTAFLREFVAVLTYSPWLLVLVYGFIALMCFAITWIN